MHINLENHKKNNFHLHELACQVFLFLIIIISFLFTFSFFHIDKVHALYLLEVFLFSFLSWQVHSYLSEV